MHYAHRWVAIWLATLFLLAPSAAQDEPAPTAVPRTSWGAPDLGGVWDFRTSTPLQRPDEF